MCLEMLKVRMLEKKTEKQQVEVVTGFSSKGKGMLCIRTIVIAKFTVISRVIFCYSIGMGWRIGELN